MSEFGRDRLAGESERHNAPVVATRSCQSVLKARSARLERTKARLSNRRNQVAGSGTCRAVVACSVSPPLLLRAPLPRCSTFKLAPSIRVLPFSAIRPEFVSNRAGPDENGDSIAGQQAERPGAEGSTEIGSDCPASGQVAQTRTRKSSIHTSFRVGCREDHCRT